jgi:hypothetical protein
MMTLVPAVTFGTAKERRQPAQFVQNASPPAPGHGNVGKCPVDAFLKVRRLKAIRLKLQYFKSASEWFGGAPTERIEP